MNLNPDVIGGGVAVGLTLLIFSYLLGDLPLLGALGKFLYRLALHVLIGASAAYALLVVWWSILYPTLPSLQNALRAQDWPSLLVPGVALVLGVLLLTKSVRDWAWLGNYSTGYLIGVGLGVAAGGAIVGTLVGQSRAAATFPGIYSPLDAALLVVGTGTVLISFTFTARWRTGPLQAITQVVNGLSWVGRVFLFVALGTAFAGVYVASVSVLIGLLTQLGIR